MSVVQDKYREDHIAGQAGQLASTTTCDVDSFLVSGTRNTMTGLAPDTAKIPFGVAVSRSESGGNMVAKGYVAQLFLGISVKDETLQPRQEDMYEPGDVASVMWRGDIYVPVASPVTYGDNVVVATSTGALSSADDGSILSVTIGTAGAGYTEGATASDTGGGTPSRRATYRVDIVGGVPSIVVLDGGEGYGSAPTVAITPATGNTPSTAAGSFTVTRGGGTVIPNAKFITAGEANGVAVVRLSGTVNVAS